MKPNNIGLDKTGTYLFKSPTIVTLVINRELTVVLCVPSQQACGIALFHPEDDPKRMAEQLTSLYEKMIDAYAVKGEDVQVKIFGLRSGTRSVMDTVTHWLEGNNLRVVARDTGGNACRKLVIHCESGKIGVSYSESTNPGQLQWLSEGSARQRNPMDSVQAEVLILTENAVKRTLARQAVEEERHWSAACPKKPIEFLSEKNIENFPYSVVLIFSDMEDERLIETWMGRITLAYQAVQMRWVGTAIPTSLKRTFPGLSLLPPLEPELLPEFKSKLKRAVFDHFTANRSEVVPFQKIKKAK